MVIFIDIKRFVQEDIDSLPVKSRSELHCASLIRSGNLEMILRHKTLRTCLLVVGLLLFCAEAKPSVPIHAVSEHFKDVAQKDAGEDLKHEKQKGETVKHEESTLSDNSKVEHSNAKDQGSYEKKDVERKAHDATDQYEGQKYKADRAEDTEQIGFKKGHKKGHHNQGFHNSYHKDESSNKSTFFDDLNDEGDQAGFNSRHNSHDDKGGRSYQGSTRDGTEFVRNKAHHGGYKRRGGHDNKQVGRNHFDRNKYLDDRLAYNKHKKGHNAYDRGQHYERESPHGHGFGGHGYGYGGGGGHSFDDHGLDHGHGFERPEFDHGAGFDRPALDHGGRGFGSGGGYAPHFKGGFEGHEEEDWGGPGYYGDDGLRHEGGYGYGPGHGYGWRQDRADYIDESRTLPVASDNVGEAPVVARRRQTITIYEDPRYDDSKTGQLRREGDVQLDVRPSGQRYARYDDEYYAPASATNRRDGRAGSSVESSKINRLVYYRRE